MNELLKPFASMDQLKNRLRGRRIIAFNRDTRTMVLDTGMVIEERTYDPKEAFEDERVHGVFHFLPECNDPWCANIGSNTITDLEFRRRIYGNTNIAMLSANFKSPTRGHWHPLFEFSTNRWWSLVKEPTPLQVAQQLCYASANTMAQLARQSID